MDNSVVDVDDDAYVVIVLEDEEGEKSSEMPSANDDEAGPSGTAVYEEESVIDPGYADIFQNLGGDSSEEGQGSLLVVAEAATMYEGVAVPDIN